MNNALHHMGFGYSPQGCLKCSSTLEFKTLKSERKMLRLASLKQGAVYTLEKTLSFKSSPREARKQVEV